MEYKNTPIEGIDIMFHTFQLDSITSSHPISIEVNKPIEINEFFDDITYLKVKKKKKILFFTIILGIFFFLREACLYE
jgi:hypothetical protein